MGRFVVVNGVTYDLDSLLATLLRRSSTATPTKVTIGATSTTVLAANTNRNFVDIVNDSDETIYVALASAAVMNEGIPLIAHGGSFEINATNMFTGAIYAICSSGSKNLAVTEG